ncbi:R3H and coiled-coil domain-containing protein 1 [Podila verticillata]|nr:R3H and coiled-coil domain-containing protein 1 [Podila verticillata]
MSDSGRGSPTGNDKRTPKVGVYVPRHRRQNNEESTEPTTGTSLSAPIPTPTSRNITNNRNHREPDSTKASSNDVQRRGRGTFKGPAGSGTNPDTNTRSKGGRDNTSNNRNNRVGGRGPSSQSGAGDSTTEPPTRHTPRGRDFDATVLRRYSDDENRPNSTFSRSSSYNSSNNGGTLSPSSSDYRSSDKSRKPSQADTRPRRVDRSWRRDQEAEETEEAESQLSKQLERVQLNNDESGGSATGSSNDNKKGDSESAGEEGDEEEEVEEWELALDNSDEDSVPKAPVSESKPKSKAAPTTSKIGNWSDVINDDMYILELYDFSSTIRTVHVTDMFASYENRSGGFRIKWLDDTRALVIFESAAIAKQAYTSNLSCQIARIRPYVGADKDVIRNEGRTSSFNAPRPQKTDSVAKRLVHGALGLRVRRTPEQIAEEKALVKAAKEAREAQRQEQQRQRQEMDAVFNS